MRYLLCNVKAPMQYKLILLVVKSMIFFSFPLGTWGVGAR